MSLLIGPFYYYILPVLQADCAHKMVIDRALVSFTSLVAHNTTETSTVHSNQTDTLFRTRQTPTRQWDAVLTSALEASTKK